VRLFDLGSLLCYKIRRGTKKENTLYYGDNLDILKRYLPDESIDLVYLDPPFKSSQNYNILFKEQNGSRAASQIRAFEDTWTWSQEDEAIYSDLVTKGGKVADCQRSVTRSGQRFLKGNLGLSV